MMDRSQTSRMTTSHGRGNVFPFIIKVGSQYVCWNSYKSAFYLGDRNHAETLFAPVPHIGERQLSPHSQAAVNMYPSGHVVWIDY
jgi:hypothetical protein